MITLSPLLPWPVLVLFALGATLLLGIGWRRGRRGTAGRGMAAICALIAALDPSLSLPRAQAVRPLVAILVDDSPSQSLGTRSQQTHIALDHLRTALAQRPDVDVREIRGGGDGGQTRLFAALDRALSPAEHARLTAILAITDGQVHDHPPARLSATPLHVMLTGQAKDRDRRVDVQNQPAYGVVGQTVPLSLTLQDTGHHQPIPLTVRVDGRVIHAADHAPDTPIRLDIPLDHAGEQVVDVETPLPPGDLAPGNNRRIVTITGIRDRLRVLLISGRPHMGERLWRHGLKSDPALDLVHFTILRQPDQMDPTPLSDMSLITFPVRELFEDKLRHFDLVILDQPLRGSLFNPLYFDNLTRYVRQGGALLAALGDDYASPQGIDSTPLAAILPARPSGDIIRQAYRPTISDLGRRHPITAGLPQPDRWGPWLTQTAGQAERGMVLLQGAQSLPLLLVDRVDQGRVGQILSADLWLWAKGYQGGGPQAELLRRTVHWLLREPDLQEDRLTAQLDNGTLHIRRHSLSPQPPTVRVTSPHGDSQDIRLSAAPDGGPHTASLGVADDGVWTVQDGDLIALAAPRNSHSPETSDGLATADRLAPFIQRSGGSLTRLEDHPRPPVPPLRTPPLQSTQPVPLPWLSAPVWLFLAAMFCLLAWRRERQDCN